MTVRRFCRLRALFAGVWALSLLATAALSGQDSETPGTTEPAEQTVKLAFKHQTGQVRKYRGTGKAEMTVTPEGGGAGLGPIPMNIKIAFAQTEKVTGTRQGTGTIAVKLDSMTMGLDFVGINMVMKVLNGKATASVNGQPLKPGQPGVGGDLKSLEDLAKNVAIVKRDPRGQITLVKGQGAGVGQVLGGASLGLAQMPDKPVKVGDSWDISQKIKPTVPGPTGSAGGGTARMADIDVQFTHTLRALEVKNGKQHAIIDSTGNGFLPETGEGPVQTMSQNFTGSTRFDVNAGAIVSGQYSVVVEATMSQAIGTPAGARGGGPNMRMDGNIQVTFREAPATPAAPAKKPAAKKN
jgi:hypothetical protein